MDLYTALMRCCMNLGSEIYELPHETEFMLVGLELNDMIMIWMELCSK